MRLLAMMVILTMLGAGCVSSVEPTTAATQFSIGISYDERSTYYEGDAVVFSATPAMQGAAYAWDLGDGTQASGQSVSHTYDAGIYVVSLVASKDGLSATASLEFAVRDIYGNVPGAATTPEPTGPPTPPPDAPPSLYQVTLPEGEPTVGGVAVLELNGPVSAGTWTVYLGAQQMSQDFDSLPVRMEIPADTAGRVSLLWLVTTDADTYGTFTFDVWGIPIEWAEPTADQWLRPGVHSEVCTVNFLFHYKHYRYFIGSAAHCIDGAAGGCDGDPTGKVGNKETLSAHDATDSTNDAWVAYNAWWTMDRIRTSDSAICNGNDFALIELGPDAQKHMHPKALFFGGPTAMADIDGYGMGTRLYGYGASNLHGNVGVGYPGQEAVNQKQGVSLGTTEAGFTQHLYFALPGVPGDSGGPAFGPGGEALGAASRIAIAPVTGSNFYTIIPKALEFMEKHEGWAPELITVDDWSGLGS